MEDEALTRFILLQVLRAIPLDEPDGPTPQQKGGVKINDKSKEGK